MELYYAPPEAIDDAAQRITLDGDEAHHASSVMRHNAGDTLYIIDGIGNRYETAIETIDKRRLTARLVSKASQPQPPTSLVIAISLMKAADRFEFFLEKATELGVSNIVPMITSRTVSRPSEGKRENKLDRWRKILLAACKQSQRWSLPTLHEIESFSAVIKRDAEQKFIAFESSEKKSLPPLTGKQILFLIGGEGGFTSEEVHLASTSGFSIISLGDTILRAETAGIFAAALVRAASL
jgi:16S rRNA (uracil1498-N3)-methyltransferase